MLQIPSQPTRSQAKHLLGVLFVFFDLKECVFLLLLLFGRKTYAVVHTCCFASGSPSLLLLPPSLPSLHVSFYISLPRLQQQSALVTPPLCISCSAFCQEKGGNVGEFIFFPGWIHSFSPVDGVCRPACTVTSLKVSEYLLETFLSGVELRNFLIFLFL